MKISLLIACLFAFFVSSHAQDSTRILMIGNSLTFYNDMPGMIQRLSEAAGKKAYVYNLGLGGHSLEMHTRSGITTYIINSREWDIVVLQGGRPWAGIKDSLHLVIPYAQKLKDDILANSPNAKIYFCVDHSYMTDVLYYDDTLTWSKFQGMITEGTKKIADSLKFCIAPCGVSFNEVRLAKPELTYFNEDSVHPSEFGSYIMACTYYSAFFKESCEGNSYLDKFDESTAKYVQEVASRVVLDSLVYWNLDKETAFEEQSTRNEFEIFPNPSSGLFNTNLGINIDRIEVFNSIGIKIVDLFGDDSKIIDIRGYPKGMYFLRIISGKEIQTKKIILNQP
jgi:hypothetical protein